MILLFLNGGDFSRMKPSTEVSTAITLARNLEKGDPLKVMFKNERYLPIIGEAFRSIGDPNLMNKIRKLDGVPLAAKDIAISSEYLMSLGYRGPTLGQIQKKIIEAIYNKEIQNTESSIKNYLDSLSTK